MHPYPKTYRAPKPKKFLSKKREPTTELILFKRIWIERRGICEVTKEKLEFDPKCFMHVLGKGARPDLRLLKENVRLVVFDFHFLYDNCSKEKTLKKYPNATWIYELRDKLKSIPVIKN